MEEVEEEEQEKQEHGIAADAAMYSPCIPEVNFAAAKCEFCM